LRTENSALIRAASVVEACSDVVDLRKASEITRRELLQPRFGSDTELKHFASSINTPRPETVGQAPWQLADPALEPRDRHADRETSDHVRGPAETRAAELRGVRTYPEVLGLIERFPRRFHCEVAATRRPTARRAKDVTDKVETLPAGIPGHVFVSLKVNFRFDIQRLVTASVSAAVPQRKMTESSS
jgi:hypothetical protein